MSVQARSLLKVLFHFYVALTGGVGIHLNVSLVKLHLPDLWS